MKRRGSDLTNYADGGQTSPVEGMGHTEQSKQKMRSAALKNGAKPPSRKGVVTSDEIKNKLRNTHIERGTKPPAMGGCNKGVRLTYCRNGHKYTPDNTKLYFHKKRNRQFQICKICERARLQAFNSKQQS
jgi:hypothetical protein